MRERYEGVCYDGPHEGRSYVQNYPSFRVALYQPLMAYQPVDFDNLSNISVRTGTYLWSEPLRKWVYRS